MKAQNESRAPRGIDQPVGLLEDAEDVRPLEIFE
jgi:hypothetical protein